MDVDLLKPSTRVYLNLLRRSSPGSAYQSQNHGKGPSLESPPRMNAPSPNVDLGYLALTADVNHPLKENDGDRLVERTSQFEAELRAIYEC
jgi:hypothetical protein